MQIKSWYEAYHYKAKVKTTKMKATKTKVWNQVMNQLLGQELQEQKLGKHLKSSYTANQQWDQQLELIMIYWLKKWQYMSKSKIPLSKEKGSDVQIRNKILHGAISPSRKQSPMFLISDSTWIWICNWMKKLQFVNGSNHLWMSLESPVPCWICWKW